MPAEPRSTVLVARVWIEKFRRDLGRPTMTDDEYEQLGHQAAADPQPQLLPDDDPAF